MWLTVFSPELVLEFETPLLNLTFPPFAAPRIGRLYELARDREARSFEEEVSPELGRDPFVPLEWLFMAA